MRRFVFALAALCCLAPASVTAGESPVSSPEKANRPKVEVVEDQEAGVVRVVIGGRTVLLIDASGLHVNGDIGYAGTSTDYGPEGFTAEAAKSAAPVHAP